MKSVIIRSSSFLSAAPASFVAMAFLMLGACSSSDPGSPAGSGGTTGSGGRPGSGGNPASGGRSGSGGSSSGSGGSTGSGGAPASGSGGSASGGNGGSVGSDAGAGGSGGTAPEAGNDGSPLVDMSNDRPTDRPADLATDTMTPGATIDSCFAGLRAGRSSYQIGNKVSADGKYRTRLALETGDRVGTSGTKPWVGYRFAIETPEGVVCVKDEAVLVAAYKGSHHNCTDSYDITAEGRRFVITNPEVDPTTPKSKLTIFMGTTMIAGPIELTNGACTTSTGGVCTTGGPC